MSYSKAIDLLLLADFGLFLLIFVEEFTVRVRETKAFFETFDGVSCGGDSLMNLVEFFFDDSF